MRTVIIGPQPDPGDAQGTIDWLVQSIREIENASIDDAIAVADSYSTDTTFTTTRILNVSAPTVANIAAVLATFFTDLQKRGINKTT